eukprot:5460913-Pleurochrysis_carterae.AAC.1
MHTHLPPPSPFPVCTSAPGMTPCMPSTYTAVHAKNILSVDPRVVRDHPQGQVFENGSEVFVSVRLPEAARLPAQDATHLMQRVHECGKRSSFLPRGDSHASVSASFWASGLKADQDICLAMPHSNVALPLADQKLCRSALIFIQRALCEASVDVVRWAADHQRLNAFMLAKILPRVEKYFFDVNDQPRDLARTLGVDKLFIEYFGSMSQGASFWNVAHTDSDVWATIIVAVGDADG